MLLILHILVSCQINDASLHCLKFSQACLLLFYWCGQQTFLTQIPVPVNRLILFCLRSIQCSTLSYLCGSFNKQWVCDALYYLVLINVFVQRIFFVFLLYVFVTHHLHSEYKALYEQPKVKQESLQLSFKTKGNFKILLQFYLF